MEFSEQIPTKYIPTPEDQDYIDIWMRFDTHIGHDETDYDYYDEYVKWLQEGQFRYDLWGGDNYELAIPTYEKFRYLNSQLLPPDEQWQDLEEQLRLNKNKHIAYIVGNHEMGRIINTNHFFDPIERLCDELDIIYSRKNSFITIRTGYQNTHHYHLYISHGRSSAREPNYPLKYLIRHGIANPADVIAIGHTHHNYSEEFYQNQLMNDTDSEGDSGNFYVTTKKILGLRPGSFLYNPEYMASDRPRPVIRGNRILRLYTNTYEWESYRNLDEWYDKND